MSDVQTRLNTAVTSLETDSALVHDFIHGADTETITTESGTVPSAAKIAKDTQDTVTAEITAVTTAKNAAEQAATDAQNAVASIPTLGNLATKNTIATVDIDNAAVTTEKLSDGAVTTSKLNTTGVTAGTYNSPTLTVGADGRVTAASEGGGSVDTQQLAKAWVSVNMQGTYTIQDSFNVSSVVDPGTGRCRVNLATPMANIDYVTLGNADNAAGTYDNYIYSIVEYNQQTRTTSKFEMQVSSTNGGRFNSPRAQFLVFGDQ